MLLYQITAASLTKGLPPPDPRSLCRLSSNEFVNHPPPTRTKFLGTPLMLIHMFCNKNTVHLITSLITCYDSVIIILRK